MESKGLLALIMLLLPLTVCGMISYAIRIPAPTPTKAPTDWPPMLLQYREVGELSFIWDMNPGAQTFVLDYTDAAHWTRTILSSTIDMAGATAILDGNILTVSVPSLNNTYTKTVEALAPNEWLSYMYLSNLQKKPTVVLKEGPGPEEITAVETFERPCFAFATKEGVKECDKDQQNSVVTREFTYRTADYILTPLPADGNQHVTPSRLIKNGFIFEIGLEVWNL